MMSIQPENIRKELSIVWFRQDLRLSDNPALQEASNLGSVLPIYILDDCAPDPFKFGEATKLWLDHSLNSLNEQFNGTLNVYLGKASEIIETLIDIHSIGRVFFNACYEPWHIDQENDVRSICKKREVYCGVFNGNYLWRPEQILKGDGSYYKVFTAYKKKGIPTILS